MYKLSIIIPVWNQEKLIVRALDSIPRRKDIQVVVVDDGSTDDTFDVVETYMLMHRGEIDIDLYSLGEDLGVGVARNKALDMCKGEYVHGLDSDDYLLTYSYEKAMNKLDGSTDIVYIDLEINNGTCFRLNPSTKRLWCAFTTKFVRREFIGDTRCDEVRHFEDYTFNERLQAKNPTEKFTHIVAYHYNHPREGSLLTEQ